MVGQLLCASMDSVHQVGYGCKHRDAGVLYHSPVLARLPQRE